MDFNEAQGEGISSGKFKRDLKVSIGNKNLRVTDTEATNADPDKPNQKNQTTTTKTVHLTIQQKSRSNRAPFKNPIRTSKIAKQGNQEVRLQNPTAKLLQKKTNQKGEIKKI